MKFSVNLQDLVARLVAMTELILVSLRRREPPDYAFRQRDTPKLDVPPDRPRCAIRS